MSIGYFTPNMKIITTDGLLNIDHFNITLMSIKVLSSNGKYNQVPHRYIFNMYEDDNITMVNINGIECSLDTEFLVIRDDSIDDNSSFTENCQENCQWICAKDLTIRHRLCNVDKQEFVEIGEIKKFPYVGKVFDIDVKDDHSYNINGIAVKCGQN